MNTITEVIFRKEKSTGVILAVFPYVIDNGAFVTSYAHIGQHSGMDYDYIKQTTPVKYKKDYQDLYNELVNIGYNLKVITKRNYSKYLHAYWKNKKGL
jgi:hypothetical protein